MDDVIFEEFKGTGNMELVLDLKTGGKTAVSGHRCEKVGDKKEDLLLTKEEIELMWHFRRISASLNIEVTEMLIDAMDKTKTNADLLRALPQLFPE